MKKGDAVRSKSSPDLGVLYVVAIPDGAVPGDIVTVASNDILIRGDSHMDDGDYDDLMVLEPCEMCVGRDAETHYTADHDEDYILRVMARDDE